MESPSKADESARPSTREIPRNEWESFLNAFSLQHDSWLVTVKVLNQELGVQVEAEDVPLRGISAELNKDRENTISIYLGNPQMEHATHIINNPTHVRLESRGAAHEALDIESEDGTKTIVRFRVPARPETVDGVMTG
ncbi:MAG TPA: DUF5335 family protein [Anaerolineae bacterium]|nr:DUF5335 family protein [Anaerolineae bacterium]